jgi:hypothetical protein
VKQDCRGKRGYESLQLPFKKKPILVTSSDSLKYIIKYLVITKSITIGHILLP